MIFVSQLNHSRFHCVAKGLFSFYHPLILPMSLYNLLFLTHKFLALFQAVRLTLDIDNGTVMQNAVQNSGGDGNVGKDLIPLREGLVGVCFKT